MATHAHTMNLSRRTMLRKGFLVSLLAGAAALAPATLTTPAIAGGAADSADAELLRRLAIAGRRRDELGAAARARRRARDAMVRHPDYPPRLMETPLTDALCAAWVAVATRSGYLAADARHDAAREAYGAAARDAFDIAPRTPAGRRARRRFALRAARAGDSGHGGGGWSGEGWLDIALADRARTAAAGPA